MIQKSPEILQKSQTINFLHEECVGERQASDDHKVKIENSSFGRLTVKYDRRHKILMQHQITKLNGIGLVIVKAWLSVMTYEQ